MGKHGIVYGKGINDMERGWRSASEWNQRVYEVWANMIQRCYLKKYHERCQTYKDCTVADRWLTLSNFVEDIVKIDGYDLWLNHPNEKVSLDKDIKSNGINKCYCLEQCMFVSHADNMRQAMSTRNYDDIKGEKNGMYDKGYLVSGEKNGNYGVHRYGENSPHLGELIAKIDKNILKILDIKYNFEYVKDDNFNHTGISSCCKGRCKTHKGFIFKYLSDVPDEQINEYIIRTKQIPITN